LDFGITLFSRCLVENPLTPRVLGSWIGSSESSTPRLIGVHGKPGLRGLSPTHLISRSYFLDDPYLNVNGDGVMAPINAINYLNNNGSQGEREDVIDEI
jgi:hypothetical protein